MKKLLIAVVMLFVWTTSCHKDNVKVERLTVAELNSKYHIDLIGAWGVQFGGTARATPNRPKKPEKNDVFNVVEGSISFDGITFTTSDHPKFAGVNNQTTVVSICDWFFFDQNLPPQKLSCTSPTGSGNIMAWNTDWSDNVFRSNLITVP